MAAGSIRKNLAEGLSYLRLQKVIVLLLIMEMGLTLFGMSYQGLMPVFADLLNLKSEGYGFMLAAAGVGSMLGSLAIASLGNYKRKGTILVVSGVLFGAALLVFSNLTDLGKALHVDTTSLYIVSLILGAAGVFGTAYTTTSNTAIQMNIADQYRGRVTSVYGMVVGFYPISTLIIGAVAEPLGAPMALTVAAGCLVVFMIVVALISPRLRSLE
jgi:MFS family permease